MNPTHLADDPHSLIAQLFARQQERALQLRGSSSAARIAKLKQLLAALEAHEPDIYRAARADLRKSEAEVDLTELFPLIAEARHAIAQLKQWMKPVRVSPTLAMLGTSAQVRHEPRGVVLIMAPWNYPLNLSLGPLVSAIAAGNTVMVKPSELAPAMSAVVRSIVEAAFEPAEVAVIEGGQEAATALLDQPFDHVFFTGSPRVGKIVMAAAAKHLSSVTLELGGKTPTIVDRGANLKHAVRHIIWGKFTNNGQTCIAPDYLLLHRDIKDAFIEAALACIDSAYGTGVAQQMQNPDYCRIVDQRHYERLVQLLNDARDHGAKLLAGGAVDAPQRFIAPTLLLDPGVDAKLLHEEIFGPLLPILTFDDIDDAIALINRRPKPLALYLYSKDADTTEKVLTQTSAGDTCINHNMIHFLHLNLPFGGVNNSGIGKSHGYYGFQAFSHQRSILRDRLTAFHLLYPPYTPFTRRLIKLAKRFLA